MSMLPINATTVTAALQLAQGVEGSVRRGIEAGGQFAELLFAGGSSESSSESAAEREALVEKVREALDKLEEALRSRLKGAGVDLDFPVALSFEPGRGIRLENVHFDEEKILSSLADDPELTELAAKAETILRSLQSSRGRLEVELRDDKFEYSLSRDHGLRFSEALIQPLGAPCDAPCRPGHARIVKRLLPC